MTMPSFSNARATGGDDKATYQFIPLISMDQFGSSPMTVGQLQNGPDATNTKSELELCDETSQNRPLSVVVPLFGRVRFLRDLYGIASLLFIVFYWTFGTWSTLAVVLIPQYIQGRVKAPLVAFYAIIAILCLATLLKAATTNPGKVPLPRDGSSVTSDSSDGFCEKCNWRKPTRTHHCTRCHQCVQRMDHHCQWINNCVGDGNHYLFLLLVVYTFALSFLTLVLGAMQLFYFPPCLTCSQASFVARHGDAVVIVSTIMGALMSVSSMGLFVSQTIALMLDVTTIEIMQLSRDWMLMGPRAAHNMPKPKTCLAAFRELCGSRALWTWPFPCGRRLPKQPADPYSV